MKVVSYKDIMNAMSCGDIFPQDKQAIKELYRKLAKEYHPDTCQLPNANEIFVKLSKLYDEAIKMIDKGCWKESNVLEINAKNGKSYNFKYLSEFQFELGNCYIGKHKVVYIFESSYEKYYKNYIDKVNSLHYDDENMKNYFERFMPKIIYKFQLTNNKYCIILNKPNDVYSLRDVFNYYKGKIDEKHVAWIISRLHNLICFLQHNGLVLNGLNIDSLFVCPKHHAILIYGGWWYCTKENEKMIGTNKEVFNTMSIKTKTNKLSIVKTDLESVKLIARKLLGKDLTNINQYIVGYINSPTENNAIKMYSIWDEFLNKAFGERKFIQMNIDEKDIYKGGM